MSDTPNVSCAHGLTVAAYVETCKECGAEVEHRAPEETAMRLRLAEAEGLLLDFAASTVDSWGRYYVAPSVFRHLHEFFGGITGTIEAERRRAGSTP